MTPGNDDKIIWREHPEKLRQTCDNLQFTKCLNVSMGSCFCEAPLYLETREAPFASFLYNGVAHLVYIYIYIYVSPWFDIYVRIPLF